MGMAMHVPGRRGSTWGPEASSFTRGLPRQEALLGQVSIEKMEIDLKRRLLVGNPEHGGEWMAEAF